MVDSPSRHTLTVGITVRHGSEDWLARNSRNYINVLAQNGVHCVILSPDLPAQLSDETTFTPDASGRLPGQILDRLDGLILSGGGDVDPHYFNAPLDGAEPDTIDRARDELELHLSRAALAINLPIFGICRGCQVLNVAAGGGMRQHLDGHRSSKKNTKYHDVTVDTASLLYRIVRESTISVNTFHHQGIDAPTLAPLFQPSAWAAPESWLIEAYDSPVHRWVLGVQWHPERLFELSEPHHQIWDSFLTACAEYRAT